MELIHVLLSLRVPEDQRQTLLHQAGKREIRKTEREKEKKRERKTSIDLSFVDLIHCHLLPLSGVQNVRKGEKDLRCWFLIETKDAPRGDLFIEDEDSLCGALRGDRGVLQHHNSFQL